MRRIVLTHEDMDDLNDGLSINVPSEDGDEEFVIVGPGLD